MPRVLTAQLVLPLPRERVFGFFAEARNLESITPTFLRFRVLTPEPIEMGTGTIIDYRLRLHGVPIRWRTLISAWDPPYRFVDEQLRGPYRLWRHEHTFDPHPEGTLCRDVVEYDHWGTPLGERLLVRPSLDRIFAFRQGAIRRHFLSGPARSEASGPESVALASSTA